MPFIAQNAYLTPATLLGAPSGIIPVTHVSGEDTKRPLLHGEATDYMARCVRAAHTGSEGLPVGVQVMALPNEDDKCLRVMSEWWDTVCEMEDRAAASDEE